MVSSQLQYRRDRVNIKLSQMADQDFYVCNVCDKTFGKQNGLTKHKNTPGVHNGLRRNEMNEIEFTCNFCEKVYSSRTKLNAHRYSKHRSTIDASSESIDEVMETTPVKVEDVYESDGHIHNEISHEKERVLEISTSLALGNVQDAVKCAFRNMVKEVVPLYVASGVEQMDAWNRVRAVTESFENELLMTLMQDTFKIVVELKRDLKTL